MYRGTPDVFVSPEEPNVTMIYKRDDEESAAMKEVLQMMRDKGLRQPNMNAVVKGGLESCNTHLELCGLWGAFGVYQRDAFTHAQRQKQPPFPFVSQACRMSGLLTTFAPRANIVEAMFPTIPVRLVREFTDLDPIFAFNHKELSGALI